MERTAACSCGSLAITTTGEPRRVSACHCLACQKRTGSAFGVALAVQLDGQTFQPEAVIDNGEPVSGNPRWLRDKDNRFLWSGLTDRPRGT